MEVFQYLLPKSQLGKALVEFCYAFKHVLFLGVLWFFRLFMMFLKSQANSGKEIRGEGVLSWGWDS